MWPSMHLSLRWGGGGCHGDMSTEKYEMFSLRTPPRQLRMRLLHNTELYRVNSDYPSAQAMRNLSTCELDKRRHLVTDVRTSKRHLD